MKRATSTTDPVYRIRPWAGGWGVFAGDESAAVEPFRTPADAVIHAKELARRGGGGALISVHDAHGGLMSEFYYRPVEHGGFEHETVPTLAASRPARRRRPRPER